MINGVEEADLLRYQITVSALSEWRNSPIWNRNGNYMGGVAAGECDGALKQVREFDLVLINRQPVELVINANKQRYDIESSLGDCLV